MTDEENEVLNLLAAAYNAFNKLLILHHADASEFTQAIHVAQNIVLARAGLRANKLFRPIAGLSDEEQPNPYP